MVHIPHDNAPIIPVGKTHHDENFPVASWLLPKAMRRQVMAFYHFARSADDIADDPHLTPDQKLFRLDQIEMALNGDYHSNAHHAYHLRQCLQGQLDLLDHARQLLDAFRRDTMVDFCRDWADLMAYCHCSAAPVGRFLLDLHGESRHTHHAADCLCAALQILNHIQDCGDDYRNLHRTYLPMDWFAMEGIDSQSLGLSAADPALRKILDKTLDHVDGLLEIARPLPHMIQHRGLRMETATILILANHLSAKLRRHDPLAKAVRISGFSFVWGMVKGGLASYLRAS